MTPWIIAHRGAQLLAPENTLAAFQAAADEGANAIELDIHLTRDNHLVVIHDDTVDRTSNGTGAIADLTLREVRQLDAGSWFSPRFTGERIPLLAEVLQLPLFPVIELKRGSERYPGIERLLAEELHASGRTADAIVISGALAPLKELARVAPEVRSLSFAVGTLQPGLPRPAPPFEEALSVLFAPPIPGMAEAIRGSREVGYQVLGTTLWVEGDLEAYLVEQDSAGLSGVFTDDPGGVAGILR